MAPMTLGNTIGVAFLSAVGASILSGSTFAQTYVYYRNYRQDPILNKCAVGVICVLDIVHLAFLVHAVYDYNVTNYGNPLALYSISSSLKLEVFFSVVVTVLVHCLYAHRVWMLSGCHKRVLAYLVIFVVVGGAAVGVVVQYVFFSSQTFAQLQESAWAVYAALGVSTSIDFVLATAMCYYLRKSKGSMDTRINSKISKIIQYTIGSGLLTSSLSLAALSSYGMMPDTYIGFSLSGFNTKLYPASFLAMLNSREPTPGGFSTMPHVTNRRPLKIGPNSESAPHFGPPQSGMSDGLSGVFREIRKEEWQ